LFTHVGDIALTLRRINKSFVAGGTVYMYPLRVDVKTRAVIISDYLAWSVAPY